MEMNLAELRPGSSGTVLKVGGYGAVKRRLFDMGITPGTEITMKKCAPLGDPLEINLRGYALTLRKAEANLILMGGGRA